MRRGYGRTKELTIRVAFWLVQDSIQNWAGWIAGLYYVRHCLDALATVPSPERPHVVAFVPEPLLDKFFESASFASCDWLEVIPVTEHHWKSSAGIAELTHLVNSQNCEVLFPAISPPCVPFTGRLLAWITDYQHKVYPEFFSPAELEYRDKLFNFLIACSTNIVCSSENVRRDMERFYPMSAGRGSVLRFATCPPSSALACDISSSLQRMGIDQPFAYLPYQFWKHKNHWTAFRAWGRFVQSQPDGLLVCSGATNDARSPEHFEQLRHFLSEQNLDQSVRILGMVSREDQWQLYRGAKLVLQPSLFEGWSTSVEEAKSLGKPLVLSNIEVHREQVPVGGNWFEPTKDIELAELLARLWKQLPDGHDTSAETVALRANQVRLAEFGRTLVQIFQRACQSDYPPIAAQILPLYLHQQFEAAQRLQVIQEQSAYQKYLTSQVEHWKQLAESSQQSQEPQVPVANAEPLVHSLTWKQWLRTLWRKG